jgi:hypothetical protein
MEAAAKELQTQRMRKEAMAQLLEALFLSIRELSHSQGIVRVREVP